MDWEWIVNQGLIEGSANWYTTNEPKPSDMSHAIKTAYLAADDAQRKQLIDMLWETGKFQGNKEEWYTRQDTWVDDLGRAAEQLAPIENRGNERNSLPGRPEIWSVGGEQYVVYSAVGTDGAPIRLSWKVSSQSDLQSFFGPGQEIVFDQTLSTMPSDVMNFGSSEELANLTEDPITTWRNTLETEAKTQPWLLDEDYQEKSLMAVLEGRPLSDSEIQQTEWYKTHTEAQRSWMKEFHADPANAAQMIEDGRMTVRQLLIDAGVSNPSDSLIDHMADQYTMGEWSQVYFNNQVQAVSDPASGIALDSSVSEIIEGGDPLDQTQSGEAQVRDLVIKWLGPSYGEWDEELIADWAGRLRNDPDAQTNLIEQLKDQKVAMFPGYDRESSYSTIAAPWSNFVRQMWGTTIDEKDPLFTDIINMNDQGDASRLLTERGLAEGNEMVVSSVQGALNQSFGGTAR